MKVQKKDSDLFSTLLGDDTSSDYSRLIRSDKSKCVCILVFKTKNRFQIRAKTKPGMLEVR